MTSIPLAARGGFETRDQARNAIESGCIDAVGIARAMVLNPLLVNTWLSEKGSDPQFPVFDLPPAGGVTVWYSMHLTVLGEDSEVRFDMTPEVAIDAYELREERRCFKWRERFL